MCNSCKDLKVEFQIKLPSDLRKALAVVDDNITDGTISDVTKGEIARHSMNWSVRVSGMIFCYITSNAVNAGRWKPVE